MSFEPALPGNWKVVSLQELTDGSAITYGVVQPGPIVTVGVPMLRVNNFRGFGLDTSEVLKIDSEIESKYGRTRLRANDVLTTIVGSVGQVAVVPKSMDGWNIARAVALVRPRDAGMAYWIALCLRSPAAQHALGIAANTTVQTTVNLKDLRVLQVPLPPPEERREITEAISALDDQIDLLGQTNTTLEAIAQTIFKSWFIDFDPVHAKANGLAPEGMDLTSAALFPDSFEDSAMGSIPKGWRAGLLGDVCENPRSQAKPGSMDPDTVYIGLEHMPRKCIALDAAGTAVGLESGKFWFKKDDVLFGKLRPYFHKVGLAPGPGICSTDILVVRPKSSDLLGFVAMHMCSDRLIAYTTQLSNGAKMPRTSWQHVESYKVTLPEQPLMAAFNEVIRPMFDSIYSNIEEARTLKELRDTLLPRLISGKLRIPEAEELIEAVAA